MISEKKWKGLIHFISYRSVKKQMVEWFSKYPVKMSTVKYLWRFSKFSEKFPLERPIPFGFPSEKVIFLYKWKASLMIATYFNRTTSWNNLNWHNLCLFSIIFQLFYCFTQHGIKPESCLHANAEGVDEKCRGVQHAFFECKRSLVR